MKILVLLMGTLLSVVMPMLGFAESGQLLTNGVACQLAGAIIIAMATLHNGSK